MFRSYLTASLLLSALLVFGGCAKKASVDVVETPEPPAAETTVQQPRSVSTAVVSENKQPTVVAPIKSVEKGLKTILFEYDSVRLTASAQRFLQINAEWLKGNPQIKATIEGHCDERGSDEYNLALGERRALATKSYLTKLGIAPERLAIISYGEERPVRSGHEELDWKQNRRVEFN